MSTSQNDLLGARKPKRRKLCVPKGRGRLWGLAAVAATITLGLSPLAPQVLTSSASAQGTGTITGYNSMCLDDYGFGTTNGTVADLWTCNGGSNQQWSVNSNGTITASNGLCLDIIGAGSTASGTLVDLWACNGGANQVWQVQGSTLVNPQSGKCLDDPAFNTTPGVQLDIWTCNGGANQNWGVPAGSSTGGGGPGSVNPPPGALPCDIYAAGGTPCVAAYSTTRALYMSYNGPLYQVQRTSDGATTNVGVLSAGGYADAATQDAFCAQTTCTITELYDQSPKHNNLGIEGPGPTGPALPSTSSTAYNFSFGQDTGANAIALPVMAGGHDVYGIYIQGSTGYRNDSATGLATGDQPEGIYMVTSGTHVNSGCCFDFGNAETNERDNGQAHMDDVNITYYCDTAPCDGSGPWVEDDLENGQYLGGDGSNPNNTGDNTNYVTAMVKNNGVNNFAIEAGNSDSGGLTTFWNGNLPNGYSPMHLEGGIVLGTGGGGDNNGYGSFFEGVITSGYPSDAAENAVQANIVSVGYSGPTTGGGPPAADVVGPNGQCLDVAGGDGGRDGTAVDLWSCSENVVNHHWTYNSDQSLETLGRCLDIYGGGTANDSKVELWDCNGGANQKWVQQANGSLLNPVSGRCLDDPGDTTTDGVQLQIYDCNGTGAQKFSLG